MVKLRYLLLLMLLIVPLGRGPAAQTATVQPSQEFPLWTRDLRRAEIVAFGSFPFTVLLGTFIVESVTYFNHGQDSRYLPWPLKGAGGVSMSRDDRFRALGVAAAGSVLISLADFIIVRYKRNEAIRAARNLPQGTPIITRRPWPESAEDAGTGEDAGSPPPGEEAGTAEEEGLVPQVP
ncbi:MAG: hypothetical protein LBU28_10945 [Spirochaetaceae bacterium]|jgi:hypothetical protein|nr:hypothetical protein [Spirochaetaceae bacterium]